MGGAGQTPQMMGELYQRIRGQFGSEASNMRLYIAEGFAKNGKRDKVNFYNIAQGSLEELRYYIILCKDLGYIKNTDELNAAIEVIAKMLYRLVSSVTNKT
jgi:four helix bundle protein